MSVGTPQKARAPSGRPPDEAHPGTRASGPTRAIWIVVAVIALGVGLAGGYLIRGTETETVTKTVTKTETVAPAANTTSDRVQARVAFDGTTCSYTGPAELKAGSTVDVKYTSPIENSGWYIWWLYSGTTWEQLIRTDARNYSDAPGPGYAGAFGDGVLGGSNPWTRLSEGDLIAIGCHVPGAGEVFPATMVRVLAA